MPSEKTDATIDAELAGLQTDDAMGTTDPKSPENLLGDQTLGDDAAVNSEEPKIVDSPENSANDGAA